MQFIRRAIDWGTTLFRWGACLAAAVMMLIIVAVVAARALHLPIAADVELIQLAMGVMVMMGLAFTEQAKSHVTVGLFVDHMSQKWQSVLDIVAFVLTAAVCAVIGWVNLTAAYEFLTVHTRTTDYLSIPWWPFKIVVGLGFWLWGLQALLRIPGALRGERHVDPTPGSGEYA